MDNVGAGELDLNVSCQNVVASIDSKEKAGTATVVYFLYQIVIIVQETHKKIAQPTLAAIDSIVDIHMLNFLRGFEVYTPPRLRHLARMSEKTACILDAVDGPICSPLIWSGVPSA